MRITSVIFSVIVSAAAVASEVGTCLENSGTNICPPAQRPGSTSDNECADKQKKLDAAGCLNSAGKPAKHCKVASFDVLREPCGSGYNEAYSCRDYAICVEAPTSHSRERKESPKAGSRK